MTKTDSIVASEVQGCPAKKKAQHDQPVGSSVRVSELFLADGNCRNMMIALLPTMVGVPNFTPQAPSQHLVLSFAGTCEFTPDNPLRPAARFLVHLDGVLDPHTGDIQVNGTAELIEQFDDGRKGDLLTKYYRKMKLIGYGLVAETFNLSSRA